MHPSPSDSAFRAAAIAFVPALARAEPVVWSHLETAVSEALAARPAPIRRQLRSFLLLLDGVSLLRHGRRLASLAPDRRVALLRALERSPLLLLRRGVWGLRTLVFLGYYTQPSVVAGLGYRATRDGWAARR